MRGLNGVREPWIDEPDTANAACQWYRTNKRVRNQTAATENQAREIHKEG